MDGANAAGRPGEGTSFCRGRTSVGSLLRPPGLLPPPVEEPAPELEVPPAPEVLAEPEVPDVPDVLEELPEDEPEVSARTAKSILPEAGLMMMSLSVPRVSPELPLTSAPVSLLARIS